MLNPKFQRFVTARGTPALYDRDVGTVFTRGTTIFVKRNARVVVENGIRVLAVDPSGPKAVIHVLEPDGGPTPLGSAVLKHFRAFEDVPWLNADAVRWEHQSYIADPKWGLPVRHDTAPTGEDEAADEDTPRGIYVPGQAPSQYPALADLGLAVDEVCSIRASVQGAVVHVVDTETGTGVSAVHEPDSLDNATSEFVALVCDRLQADALIRVAVRAAPIAPEEDLDMLNSLFRHNVSDAARFAVFRAASAAGVPDRTADR